MTSAFTTFINYYLHTYRLIRSQIEVYSWMYESPGYLNPRILSIPLKYGLESDNWVQYIQGIKSDAQYNEQVELFISWCVES